jgi:hypothetical protein
VKQGRIPIHNGFIDTDEADPMRDSGRTVVRVAPVAARPAPKVVPVAAAEQPKARKPRAPRVDAEADPSLSSIVKSRAVKEAYAARLIKLEFEEKSKSMLPATEVRDAAFTTARRVRDLLMSVPDRMAPMLEMRPTADVHRELTNEMRRICEEMARWAKL